MPVMCVAVANKLLKKCARSKEMNAMSKISVIMANYCGAEYVQSALESVLRQTHADLEILVVDDASPDASVACIKEVAARDERVFLIEAPKNGGAAAARNLALCQASGDWVAIVDSDDLLHPQRFARLLQAAQLEQVKIVADDMLFFSTSIDAAGKTLLESRKMTRPWRLNVVALAGSEDPAQDLPQFGYLKMLISREIIGSLRYDESLAIAEDYDFYVRLMAQGEDCLILPDPMYLYRRHEKSLSYRLSAPALMSLIAAQTKIEQATAGLPELRPVFTRRKKALERALAYQRLVDSLKGREVVRSLRSLCVMPSLVKELGASVMQKARRSRRNKSVQTPRALHLSANAAKSHSIPIETPPNAGEPWKNPPSHFAAQLSNLAAQHQLDLTISDPAGLWAGWLVPFRHSVTVDESIRDSGPDYCPAPQSTK